MGVGEGCQEVQSQSPWLVDHPDTAVTPAEVTVTGVQKCRKSYTQWIGLAIETCVRASDGSSECSDNKGGMTVNMDTLQ